MLKQITVSEQFTVSKNSLIQNYNLGHWQSGARGGAVG
jgi:hypothetical protein